MSDDLFKILILFHDEIEKTLKDSSINDYTRWKYERFRSLCQFLLDEFSL